VISRREEILDAFTRQLAEALAPTQVDRNREVAVDLHDVPIDGEYLVVPDPVTEAEPELRYGLTIYPLELVVKGYVRTDFKSVGPRLSHLRARVLQAIGTDPRLGGRCQDLIEGTFESEVFPSGGAFAQAFLASYRTETWNPYGAVA